MKRRNTRYTHSRYISHKSLEINRLRHMHNRAVIIQVPIKRTCSIAHCCKVLESIPSHVSGIPAHSYVRNGSPRGALSLGCIELGCTAAVTFHTTLSANQPTRAVTRSGHDHMTHASATDGVGKGMLYGRRSSNSSFCGRKSKLAAPLNVHEIMTR